MIVARFSHCLNQGKALAAENAMLCEKVKSLICPLSCLFTFSMHTFFMRNCGLQVNEKIESLRMSEKMTAL